MTVLKWSVGILAILNIVLLVNTWKKPGFMPPPRHMEGGPGRMIIEELKLSQEQIQQFEKLKEAHRSAMRELDGKGKELRNQYFDLLKQEQSDQKLSGELLSAIANNQKIIENVTFDHFRDVRKLCNVGQKKTFDSIIGDILRNMAGPPRGGSGPHPPH